MSLHAILDQALALQRQGKLDEAEALYLGVLERDPRDFNALHMLGVIRYRQRRHADAISLIERALEVLPGQGGAINNLANALRDDGRFVEAIARYDDALVAAPGIAAEVLANRGVALQGLGRPRDAEADFLAAQALDPACVDAHLNDGIVKLSMGNYAEGWPQYEWRWQRPAFARTPPYSRWQGKESLQGRSILLESEQGLGDTIQFVRYIPLLEARGAKVLLLAQAPLRKLLQDSFPAVQVLEDGETPPADFHCPLMSLPHAFRTTLESIPASVPYLRARKPPVEPGRIGVAWAGNSEHLNDRWRSIRPELLAPLDSFEFQSLPRSGDMADTAAAISRMDLVISVDTAAAHLAGALGKPVWVLLPYVADWRWLGGRADSPWYPSATLFRQPAPGDWETVLRQVAEKLAKGLISRI